MANAPETRPSLLVRIRQPQDIDAWRQFVDLYGPLVGRFARKRGLQDADAEDLTQTVLQAVSASIRRLDYDPGKGTFRSWLYTIVRRQLRAYLARQQRDAPGSGDSGVVDLLEQQPDRDAGEAALWEQEYQRQRFRWICSRVRDDFQERTWQAFWLSAVEGQEGAAVARELGMTVGAVYTSRSRVLQRIREEVDFMETEERSG